jgi:hypothetical protein
MTMQGSQLMTDNGLTVDDVEASEGSTSGTQPTEEGAEYFDAIENLTITGDDGPAVLGATTAQLGRGYMSRELLRDEVKRGNLDADGGWDPFDGRTRTKEERAGGKAKAWDSIIFDLTQYSEEDQPRARRAIIEAIKSPEYTVQTNTGATRHIKGLRSYSAWGIHRQHGVGAHFQMKIFSHAIDGRKISGSSSFGLDFIRDMENRAIDAALEAEGLAPLVGGGIQRAAVAGNAQQAAKVLQAVMTKRGGATPTTTPTATAYTVSDPHTERERFLNHQRAELKRAAEIQEELDAITTRTAILQDAAAAVDALEIAKQEVEAEKAARAEAEATATAEAEARQRAEAEAEQANTNAQRLAAALEETAEKLANETTERTGLEETLQAERDLLAEAIGSDAEGEQPEAIAGLAAMALARVEAEAQEARTKAARLEEEARKNEAALLTKLQEVGFSDVDGLLGEFRAKAQKLAATENARDTAEQRADKAEARAAAMEQRADAADIRAQNEANRAQNEADQANNLRVQLADSVRDRAQDQATFMETLKAEREAMQAERQAFKKELKEQIDEARKEEASRWGEMVERLKEEIAHWKQAAERAYTQLETFIKTKAADKAMTKAAAAKTETPKSGPKGGGGPK